MHPETPESSENLQPNVHFFWTLKTKQAKQTKVVNFHLMSNLKASVKTSGLKFSWRVSRTFSFQARLRSNTLDSGGIFLPQQFTEP